MNKSDRKLVAQGIFGAVALTMGGFLAGLKRLVWALWVLVSVLWILVWLYAMKNNPNEKAALFLLAAFVPPAILFLVVSILSGIADALRGAANNISAPESTQMEEQLGRGK